MSSVILRPRSAATDDAGRIQDIYDSARQIRKLALLQLGGFTAACAGLPSGVQVSIAALDLRDRAPWLQSAARLLDLASTDLIDACHTVGGAKPIAAADRYGRARRASASGRVRFADWSRPTVDFAADELISMIAGLDAFLSE